MGPKTPNSSNILDPGDSEESVGKVADATSALNASFLDLDKTINEMKLSFSFITDTLTNVGNQLVSIINPIEIFKTQINLDKEASRLVRAFGVSKDKAGELTQTLTDAIPGFIAFGGSVGDAGQTIKTLAESFDTNMSIAGDTLVSFAATAKVTGVEQGKLATSFRDVGVSLGDIDDRMLKVVETARNAGITTKAVSDLVTSNLDKMNLYNFNNGVVGLAKMAAQASRLGIDMNSIFSTVDKVFNPEGAIELSSALQRLGVTTSDLLDPLRLMDLAQNDPTELQNQIVNMTKEFVKFNTANNQFEILPGAKRRLNEIGAAFGYSNGQLQKMAINAANFDYKLKQLKFPSDLASKEDKEFLATISQIGEKGSQFEGRAFVQVEQTDATGAGTGRYISKALEDLSSEDINQLKKQTDIQGSMEDIARNQLDYVKRIESNLNSMLAAAKYGVATSPTLQGLFQNTMQGAVNMTDIAATKPFNETKFYRENTDDFIKAAGQIISALVPGSVVSTFEDLKNTLENMLGGIDFKSIFQGIQSIIPKNITTASNVNTSNVNMATNNVNNVNQNDITFTKPLTIEVKGDNTLNADQKQLVATEVTNWFTGPDKQKNIELLFKQMGLVGGNYNGTPG
jgi:hypothetical protein